MSGGEPMMRPDLYQLIERCRLEGIAIALRSNATLITPQRARRLDEVNFATLVPQGRGSYLGDEALDQAARRQVTRQLCAASKEAWIAVTPSCTLVGRCWACVEPNVTCDGWVTPCYLSSHRLFRLLETDPAEAEQVLGHHRPSMVHACRHAPGVLWEGTSAAVLEVTA